MKKKEKKAHGGSAAQGFKATTQRARLKTDLALLKRASDAKSTIPVLSHVLIRAAAGELLLEATDLDRRITIDHDYDELVGEGAIAVPIARLEKVLGAVRWESVDLVLEGTEEISVCAGPTKIKIAGRPEEDFPTKSDLGSSFSVPLWAGALETSMCSILHCVSAEESRFQLQGAWLEITEGELWMAGTDGHRLAARRCSLDAGSPRGEVRPILFPRTAMEDFLAIKPKGSSRVELRFGADFGQLETGGIKLFFRLLEGVFPDWRRVILREPRVSLVVPASELVEAATLAIKCDIRSLGLHLNGDLRLRGSDGEGTDIEHVITLPEDPDRAEQEVHLGVQPKYLLDAVKHCESAEVELLMTDQHTQMGICAPGTFTEYPQIIMPMRI